MFQRRPHKRGWPVNVVLNMALFSYGCYVAECVIRTYVHVILRQQIALHSTASPATYVRAMRALLVTFEG